MKKVGITQRVSVIREYGERRDCLDQAWPRFLAGCGLMPLALPNVIEVATALCAGADVTRLVLTGGSDLAMFGGDAPGGQQLSSLCRLRLAAAARCLGGRCRPRRRSDSPLGPAYDWNHVAP